MVPRQRQKEISSHQYQHERSTNRKQSMESSINLTPISYIHQVFELLNIVFIYFKNDIVLKYTKTRQQTKCSIHKSSDSKQLFPSINMNTIRILLILHQCKSRLESGLKVCVCCEMRKQ